MEKIDYLEAIELLKSEKSNIVMLSSPTCSKCKFMKYHLDRINKDLSGVFYEVDLSADDNMKLAEIVDITTVPKFLIRIKKELFIYNERVDPRIISKLPFLDKETVDVELPGGYLEKKLELNVLNQ